MAYIYKTSFIGLSDGSKVKTLEFKDNLLILRFFIEKDFIAEYQIPLKELKEALKKV